MTTSIWKYPLQVIGEQLVHMPKGAKVLTVQVQYGEPQIWVQVDERAITEPRTFTTYGTGESSHEGKDPGRYIGTYQLYNGAAVFHVFERTP